MISKANLKRINDFTWEIPKNYRSDMNVPARIYASEKMLDDILKDRSVDQLVNVATLGGVVGHVLVMPDVHEGYGFPIGGVAATLYPEGAISPGGIGYDINCGVRLLLSDLYFEEAKPFMEKLVRELFDRIPSGVGRGGSFRVDKDGFSAILKKGAKWVVEYGYGEENDTINVESHGSLEFADLDGVSQKAKERGINQLGTLGAGNHFVEVDVVDEVFDPRIAKVFGLDEERIVALIHTGSRGFGHQIATDYVREMLEYSVRKGQRLVDRELASCSFSSPEGRNYFGAMGAAANFAWANRQIITHYIRGVWKKVFGDNKKLKLLYDVAHNIAKIETHEVDGRLVRLIVHRKGATRSFGPGSTEVPGNYRTVGQPVIVPGSMGTSSYVLAGAEGSRLTFGSCCHGAGRAMSRQEARREVAFTVLKRELISKGVYFATKCRGGFVEEAPLAYKNVEEVIDVVTGVGIARKVARLRPVGVVKG